MTFKIWDLILEQERLSNKKNINRVCKILDRNDINTSQYSLKSLPPRGNTLNHEKENKQYFDQLRAKKDKQIMNKWIPLKLWWQVPFLDRQKNEHIYTRGNVVQRWSMI